MNNKMIEYKENIFTKILNFFKRIFKKDISHTENIIEKTIENEKKNKIKKSFRKGFIKNRSITSGINILLLTFGITITELLLSKDINIVKYTFLPYIDLSYYKNNLIDTINQLYDINLSLKLGIPILLFYSILFTLIGIRIFKKKNI